VTTANGSAGYASRYRARTFVYSYHSVMWPVHTFTASVSADQGGTGLCSDALRRVES
jgi:hypothetical protein